MNGNTHTYYRFFSLWKSGNVTPQKLVEKMHNCCYDFSWECVCWFLCEFRLVLHAFFTFTYVCCMTVSSYFWIKVVGWQKDWKKYGYKNVVYLNLLPSNQCISVHSILVGFSDEKINIIVAFVLQCISTHWDHIPTDVFYHLLYRPKSLYIFSLCKSHIVRCESMCDNVWQWYLQQNEILDISKHEFGLSGNSWNSRILFSGAHYHVVFLLLLLVDLFMSLQVTTQTHTIEWSATRLRLEISVCSCLHVCRIWVCFPFLTANSLTPSKSEQQLKKLFYRKYYPQTKM